MIGIYDWMTDEYICSFYRDEDLDIQLEMLKLGYEQGDYYIKIIT